MSDVDIIINVATQGAKSITDLSASLRSLNKGLVDLNIPLKKLDAHSQAVAKALGMGARSANDHAKTLKGLIANQKALGTETKRIRTEIGAYRAAIVFAGTSNKAFRKEADSAVISLKAMDRALRGMRIRAFGSDLRATSTRIQKIGKDAQFVGRSLMINLTAPLTLFARTGFQQLLAVDKELVRLTKVLDNVAMSAEQANRKLGSGASPKQVQGLINAFNSLNNELTKISSNYGVSKQLIVGLASDFAELGVNGHESILALTELTAQIEKLGAMDISGAQDLTQALYFQSVRAYENTGAFQGMTRAIDREALAVKAATTQMYLFNAIENVTALTLKDLGQAFPEVASMAVSFGLSMTEAAALLAPMKAAGLDVGASANSIKVSLQRALSPTTKNIKILQGLAESFGEAGDEASAFATAAKTGLTGLQSITEIFDKVKNSEAGMEGAMKLMSNLFEKRQGPRMYLAIEQLSLFNAELNKTTRSSISTEGMLAGVAETALQEFNALNNTSLPNTINNFRDIGIIARIATGHVGQLVEGYVDATGKQKELTAADIATAKATRKAVADRILLEKQTKGRDVVSEVKTETGRAMIVELAGASNAAEVANAELAESLKSLSVVTERLKNNFKLFAADIMKAVVPMLKKLSDKVQELMNKWNNSTQEFRDRVSKVITIIVSFLAALGPVVLAIGTMQAVTGVLGRAIAVFIPKLATETGAFIGLGKAIRGATTSLAAHTAAQNKSYLGAIKNKLFGKADMRTPADAIKELTAASSAKFGTGYKPIEKITAAREAKILDEEQFKSFQRLNPSRSSAAAQKKLFKESKRISEKIATSGAFSLTPKEAAFQARNALKVASIPTAMSEGATAATPIIARKKQIFDRSDLYARKGIMTDADGSRFFSKSGREISEKRAGQLATGQMAGRIGLAKDTAISGIKDVGVKGKNLGKGFIDALNPVKQYRLAVSGARGAVAALQAQNALMGLSAPGMFAKARAGVMGFVKGIKIANIAMKLLRVTMIASGIGAILLLIGVAVYAVMKNFDKFKETAKPALDALSQAFFVIKNAAIEVLRPIFDLFAVFGKGAEGGAGAAQGIGAAFAKLEGIIEFVGSVISDLLTDIIKPVFQSITNIVMFVVSIFKGAWGDAFGYLLAALSFLGKAFINVWKLLATATISIITGLAKGIVTLLLKGIVNGLIQGVLLAIRGVINLIGLIPGMGKLMDGLNNAVKGAGGAVSRVISSATNGINKVIDGGGNLAKKGVNLIADNINKVLDAGTKKGIKQSTGNLFKGKGPITGAGKELGEAGGEAIANAMGDAAGEGADKAGKAIKDGIKDAAQKLQDYVRDAFKSALEKMIDATVAAMKKQKEAGLKVFDVQLKTLEKLEKAEESLTKTKEYQQNLRKILDDRDLNRANYIRNRALAIYEGRVDDARMLDLEQQGAETSSVADETSLNDSRRKDLAAENLAALREAIAEAKEKAGELFDLQIEAFQKAAADIIKIGPVTIEQYAVMQKELETLANTSSTKMNEDFGTMFEKFVTTIGDKMPNQVVGAFSTSLDLLVAEARAKYGLGDDASENTIIGVTLGMLTSIGDKMGEGGPAVVAAFGAITTDLHGNFTTAKDLILVDVQDKFLTPFKKAFDDADPTAVFNQAIKDGNAQMLRDFENTLELNKALMDKMVSNLDPAIKKYIELKAAIDAANDAAAGGGGAGDGAGFTGNVKNLVNPMGGMAVDTYLASLAVKNRSILPTTLLKQTAASARAGAAQATARGASGYKTGGYIPAPTEQGVPALLHGGEYVLNAKAVQRIGVGALEKMNNNLIPRFKKGGRVPGGRLHHGDISDTMERIILGKITSPQNNRYVTPDMLSRNSVVNNTTFKDDRYGDFYDRSGQPGGARFIKMVPVFPQPQPIQRMPTQLAGYTDYARREEDRYSTKSFPQNTSGRRVNVAGKPAVGVRIDGIRSAQDFFNTRSVFVNPRFKDPYDKIGNDPDSSDRSRGPQIVDETKLDTLRAMSRGVMRWAEATSKYFNKPFVVGKSPVAFGTKDAPLTTRVNIYGASGGEGYAGYVFAGGSFTPGIRNDRKVLKAPGGENRVTPAKALRKNMTLNTDLDRIRYSFAADKWANVVQHEFGHTMGLNHPHSRRDGTTLNSEMSYDAPDFEATILPATINAYKKVMDMNLGYTGVAEIEKKLKLQRDAAYELYYLNRDYDDFGKNKNYVYNEVQKIGVGALEKINNNLVPQFKKGGRVPGGSADTMERRILGKSNAPIRPEGDNFIQNAIIAATTLSNYKKIPKAAVGIASSIAQSFYSVGAGLLNVVGSIGEIGQKGKSIDPMTNFIRRQEGGRNAPLNPARGLGFEDKSGMFNLAKDSYLGVGEAFDVVTSFPLFGAVGKAAGVAVKAGAANAILRKIGAAETGLSLKEVVTPAISAVLRRNVGSTAATQITSQVAQQQFRAQEVLSQLPRQLPSGPRMLELMPGPQIPQTMPSVPDLVGRINGAIPLGRPVPTGTLPITSLEEYLLHGGPRADQLAGGVINPDFIRGGALWSILTRFKKGNSIGRHNMDDMSVLSGSEQSQNQKAMAVFNSVMELITNAKKHGVNDYVKTPLRDQYGQGVFHSPTNSFRFNKQDMVTEYKWGEQIEWAQNWLKDNSEIIRRIQRGEVHSTGVPVSYVNAGAYEYGGIHLLKVPKELNTIVGGQSRFQGITYAPDGEIPFWGMHEPIASAVAFNEVNRQVKLKAYQQLINSMIEHANKNMTPKQLADFEFSQRVYGNEITPAARQFILDEFNRKNYHVGNAEHIRNLLGMARTKGEMKASLSEVTRRYPRGHSQATDNAYDNFKTIFEEIIEQFASPRIIDAEELRIQAHLASKIHSGVDGMMLGVADKVGMITYGEAINNYNKNQAMRSLLENIPENLHQHFFDSLAGIPQNKEEVLSQFSNWNKMPVSELQELATSIDLSRIGNFSTPILEQIMDPALEAKRAAFLQTKGMGGSGAAFNNIQQFLDSIGDGENLFGQLRVLARSQEPAVGLNKFQRSLITAYTGSASGALSFQAMRSASPGSKQFEIFKEILEASSQKLKGDPVLGPLINNLGVPQAISMFSKLPVNDAMRPFIDPEIFEQYLKGDNYKYLDVSKHIRSPEDFANILNVAVKELENLMNTHGTTLTSDILLHRGLGAPLGEGYDVLKYTNLMYDIGKPSAPQFRSTSVSQEAARAFTKYKAGDMSLIPVLEHIIAPKGTRVFMPEVYGYGMGNEREVLLPPSYRFVPDEIKLNERYGQHQSLNLAEIYGKVFKYTPAAVGGGLALALSENSKALASDMDNIKKNKLQQIFDVIASGESSNVKNPYEAFYKGRDSMMEGMTTMSVDDVLSNAQGRAIGKYQFMPKYMPERLQAAGLESNAIFNSENQEKMMTAMFWSTQQQAGLGGSKWLTGKVSTIDFVNLIAKTFRGVPQIGGEYFGGGENITGIDPERKDLKLVTLLEQLKSIYGQTSARLPGYKIGGYVPGSPSMPFPAILHGGEYVVNADAVRNMGVATMRSINQSKFRTPSGMPSYTGSGQATSVSTVNINVDTFIGEEEWFKGMMKDYNINIAPRVNKATGNETRSFTTYNGLNQ